MNKEKQMIHRIDYGLIFILLLFMGISLISIYNATNGTDPFYFVRRQIMWYGLGFIAIVAVLFIDYRRFKELALPMYIAGLILLLLVTFVGEETKGAQRWIELAGFKFQPSEFMKIFLIIALAHFFTKFQEAQDIKSLKGDFNLTTKIAFISIIPFALILKQPDLGTALVLIGIVATMLLTSGISWRILALLLLLGITLITGLVFLYFVNFDLFSKLIETHQLNRIYAWLDPYADEGGLGYQLIQAMTAIGSGELMGRGLGEGIQAKGGWIPEVHTDFIFAVIGEEFGFIGASILISIYFIFIYRLIQIALTCNDIFGAYLISGIIGMIIFQVFQNIGMTIGLMPITGIALPFISYGGSALLTNMLAMGIVLNVSMRTKVYMFD